MWAQKSNHCPFVTAKTKGAAPMPRGGLKIVEGRTNLNYEAISHAL